MAERLLVESSPHRHSGIYTERLMLDVIIALIPAIIAGTVFFRFRALCVIALSAAFSLLCEYAFCAITKKKQTVSDLSALVTGILLALNLPPHIPFYIVMIGDAFAIIIVKCLFGGLGKNFANPAIAARIVLMASFPSEMSKFYEPFSDTVASATPLVLPRSAGYLDLFLGNVSGCIGEVSALALILGFIYMLARRVIKPTIPLIYLGTAAVFGWIVGADPVYTLLSGGIMLGAVFMATDYVTSPVNFKGQVVFAIGCGFFTILIREFGSLPEGTSYAILLMNILVPLLEKIPRNRPFGAVEGKR